VQVRVKVQVRVEVQNDERLTIAGATVPGHQHGRAQLATRLRGAVW
jgi:hypothetical protein